MAALVLAVLLAADPPAASMAWERDHGAAYTAAEERGAPLLLHFRSDFCERTNPGLPGGVTGISVGGGTGAPETPRSTAGAGAGGRRPGDARTDCDAMEELVWSNAQVVAQASRFVLVLTGDTSERTLTRRYEVATMPTTLIADPWGNEIVRLVHYVDAARLLRILKAIPQDFSPLAPVARDLRQRPHDPELLLKAASFYEVARLPEIAERYYERAWESEGAKKDAALRRRIGMPRGTNLLRIGKPADAAHVFRATFEEAKDAAQGDMVLFGWLMAELQQGHVNEADRPYRELLSRFPDSKYTAKAKENMAAAAAKKG